MLHPSAGPGLFCAGILEIRHPPTKPCQELRPALHKEWPGGIGEGSEGYEGDTGLILETGVDLRDVFCPFPVTAALTSLAA